jgi:hypothetical protein
MFAARAFRQAATRTSLPRLSRNFSSTKRNDMKVRARAGARRRTGALKRVPCARSSRSCTRATRLRWRSRACSALSRTRCVPGVLDVLCAGSDDVQLGLRKWLEEKGHELVVTHDKEGSESVFQKHIVDVCASRTAGCLWC